MIYRNTGREVIFETKESNGNKDLYSDKIKKWIEQLPVKY